ncbi:MAG: tRNA epoxyqueuosine(34) reductase QueG [Anaerolineae bacterium]
MGLEDRLKDKARELGFDLTGIAPVGPLPHGEFYREWLVRGFAAGMGYLARPDAVAKRLDVRQVLPEVQSVVVVAKNYYVGDFLPEHRANPLRGLISRYAWGEAYQRVMLRRLQALARWLVEATCHPVRWRAYVDTGPVLEREWAVRAGLGFIGRNTLLIHPRWGSYLFLGVLLTNVGLQPDPPETGVGCGTCQRCLQACPTGALVAPYTLDARRCISYLTIEHRGPLPERVQGALGNWVFGCDVCQEVCPWNRRFAQPTRDPAFQPRLEPAPRLDALLNLSPATFERTYAPTPVQRAGVEGLRRNAQAVLQQQMQRDLSYLLIPSSLPDPPSMGGGGEGKGCLPRAGGGEEGSAKQKTTEDGGMIS